MKRIALLAATLLFASCQGEPTLSDAELTFTSSAATSTPGPAAPAVVGEGGAIRVSGRYSSRCLGGTLHAGLTGSGRNITLVVEWEEPSGCFTAIGTHAYEAVISRLEPGDYRLRVIHEGEAGAGEREMFDGTVRVRHPNLR
jgi:hypothetical protein